MLLALFYHAQEGRVGKRYDSYMALLTWICFILCSKRIVWVPGCTSAAFSNNRFCRPRRDSRRASLDPKYSNLFAHCITTEFVTMWFTCLPTLFIRLFSAAYLCPDCWSGLSTLTTEHGDEKTTKTATKKTTVTIGTSGRRSTHWRHP